jgi:alkanesulfonate monooxygenase SsuD/methylene tetrahydromethanopterin reductase-like flavin-dependent oxidoreductase (luciferase family)
MTYAAACTQRLRIGCVVFVSTLHSPVDLAKGLSTLDQLSRGRLDIGIGTGGKHRPFAAFGLSPDRYVARFTEGLALMKALWTEPRVTFNGEFWQLADAAMEPKPFQKPHPPVWFGANGAVALRRAARLGVASSARGPSVPPGSPTRSRSSARHSLRWVGQSTTSRSPSACTSPSTRTGPAHGTASIARLNVSTATGLQTSKLLPSPEPPASARPKSPG